MVGMVAAHQVTFENYKVFKITPVTEIQSNILHRLVEMFDGVSKAFYFQHKEISKHKLKYFILLYILCIFYAKLH